MISKAMQKMIGQMIMIGFQEAIVDDHSPIVRTIKNFQLGGVILYNINLKCYLAELKKKPDLDRNEAAKICPKNIISALQLKSLTTTLQRHSKVPLLISVDQEGGLVSRLGPAAGFQEPPSPKTLGETDNLNYTTEVAAHIARNLKEGGINVNLAPVVDLNLNPKGLIAKNGRSFGGDPSRVYRHAQAFIVGHRREEILTTLKHFPGKGSAGEDTHFEMADVTSCYQEQELLPFSFLIQEGLTDLIMTSHIHHRGWDREYPVTLSKTILNGFLRKELGYQGVIISDDLQMGAIVKQFSLEEACVLAVQAGVDILLASNNSPEGDDPNLFSRMFESLCRAVDDGKITKGQIEKSFGRIMDLKKRLG
jgi:beta-N-acetylhexosaminidase